MQEWAILPNNNVPNTANMEFNWLTFNGKAAPDTTPIVVRQGNRVRIRLVNMGMDHHPIHLHGNTFAVTGRKGADSRSQHGARQHGAGGRGAGARHRVCGANPGRLDAALPSAAPHDEQMSDLMGDRMMTTMRLDGSSAMSQMQTYANTVGVPHRHHAPIAEDAEKVPGFPQDAFMEMGMDEAVYRPEHYGLPTNWSASFMGMMTLVRIVPDELYEKIQSLKSRPANDNAAPPAGGRS